MVGCGSDVGGVEGGRECGSRTALSIFLNTAQRYMCIPHPLLGVLCSMEEITQPPIQIFKGNVESAQSGPKQRTESVKCNKK